MNKLEIKDEQAIVDFLNSTRKEMYDCLTLFYTHVKQIITFVFTFILAAIALFQFSRSLSNNHDIVFFSCISGVLFWIISLIGFLSIGIIRRYYKLYVASLFYAYDIHSLYKVDFHDWFRQLDEDKAKAKNKSRSEIIEIRTTGKEHSFFKYKVLLMIISTSNFLLGSSIILWTLLDLLPTLTP